MSRSLIHLAVALWTGLIVAPPAIAAQVGEFQCSNGSWVRRVEVVAELDPQCDEDVKLAWRIAMAPGITYMKHMYARF